MPTTKKTYVTDENAAEHWMVLHGYDVKDLGAGGLYGVRRAVRNAYALGLGAGRVDGLTYPHFTKANIEAAAEVVRGEGLKLPHSRSAACEILRAVFPHATFEEDQ